jgi:hypothetical protein
MLTVAVDVVLRMTEFVAQPTTPPTEWSATMMPADGSAVELPTIPETEQFSIRVFNA